MGGHDHGHPSYIVPDYKIYKVEDVPQLLKTQRALEAQGLSDPWLRNEVWRYNPKVFGTEGQRARSLFFRGFRTGFVLFVLTMIGTTAYDKTYPSEHNHDEHH